MEDSTAFDENDVFLDEEGSASEIFDRETGERFVDDAGNPIGDPNEIKDEDENGGGDKGENKNDLKFHNSAHFLLHQLGYQDTKIDFDGTLKDVSELTLDEQNAIIATELEKVAQQSNELGNLKGIEKDVVDFLRKEGDPVKLAKFILDNHGEGQSALSDEEVVTAALKKEFPEYSDDDIKDELEELKKSNAIARRAKAYRSRMESGKLDLSGLIKEQDQAIQTKISAFVQDHEKESTEIKEYVSKLDSIAGFKLNDTVKEFITKEIVSDSYDKDSPFVASINSPERLARLKFLDAYFDDIIKRVQNTSYQKGVNDANRVNLKGTQEDFPSRGNSNSQSNFKFVNRDADLDTALNKLEEI